MDLSTTYLGLELGNPFIVGASPLADHLDQARAAEDAGAAAIVLRSLFQEQVMNEHWLFERYIDPYHDAHPEAASYLDLPADRYYTPDAYLEHVRRVKAAVAIPVIGSLNGTSPGDWLDNAQLIAEAGADAIELNLYAVQCRSEESGAEVERRHLDVLSSVRSRVRLPIAVKLAPFYASMPHFAMQLKHCGADGLVLFNRFYQADIDVEELEVRHTLALSNSSELLLRLRWLAILSPFFKGSLASSGGVHSGTDALKALMAGANAVQVVSAVLKHGVKRLAEMRDELARWLSEHEYGALREAVGSMNLARCPDPGAYERANYIRVLSSWTPP